jgi:hypothetical protein
MAQLKKDCGLGDGGAEAARLMRQQFFGSSMLTDRTHRQRSGLLRRRIENLSWFTQAAASHKGELEHALRSIL